MKIAAISSKKLGDVNEGQLNNKYQYQGDYSEYNDDISWNDFDLRNYDPQIGRWVEQDPFHQFPSPYTGMGNDPVNLVDPSGGIGIPCPGTSALSIFFMKAGELISHGLSAMSEVSSFLSIGINVAKVGTQVYDNSVQSKFIEQQSLGNITIQVGIPEQVSALVKEDKIKEAAALIIKSYPNELNDPDLIRYEIDPYAGGHTTWPERGKSRTIFAAGFFQNYAFGKVSFGLLVRSIFHEINHVRVNSEKIHKHFGWDGETEVIAYTEMFLNTTLPKFDPKKESEKRFIQLYKKELISHYYQMKKEGQDFYKEKFDKTIQIMDELLKQ